MIIEKIVDLVDYHRTVLSEIRSNINEDIDGVRLVSIKTEIQDITSITEQKK